jgi:hypothetical protein
MTVPALPVLTFAALDARAAQVGLRARGGFQVGAQDEDLPAGTETVVLLDPREPGFWAHVTAEPESADGRPDPLDRRARRTVGRLACALAAKALFPFAGPPWRPFLSWALRTGRVHRSPVGMLVHGEAGLRVSLRGALALKRRIEVPAPAPSPCEACPRQPCRSACPVGALGGDTHDTDAGRPHLGAPRGADCMDTGCRARRACPVSARHPRAPTRSAFHTRDCTGAR